MPFNLLSAVAKCISEIEGKNEGTSSLMSHYHLLAAVVEIEKVC